MSLSLESTLSAAERRQANHGTKTRTQHGAPETKTMQNLRKDGTETRNAGRRRAGKVAVVSAGLVLAAGVTGCGISGTTGTGTTGSGGTTTAVRFTGNVHGGQQPVSGATIQLYTVGTSGLKSASTPLLTGTVTTDANGNFSITSQYSCTGATQVYITATGGNPGGGTNANLSLATALGLCSTLTPTTFIQINEVTTAAAAYALAPFAADLTHVGSNGASPAGIYQAFANAALLANSTTGTAGGANLASGVSVPVAELNSLADILASCVNTTGASSTPCTQLFAATGATDTFGAALGMANNPGAASVTALANLVGATPPFQPTWGNNPPSDFTVAVTMTGGGVLSTPYAIAIDASGNAWVTNTTGAGANGVTELSSTGAVNLLNLIPSLAGAQGIAVDQSGNVWVANTGGNSVVKATLSSGVISGTQSFTTGGLAAPTSIAINSLGSVFVTNFNGNSVTGLASSGTPLSGSPFTGSGNIVLPSGISIGLDGKINVGSSGNGAVVKLTSTGAYSSTLTDLALQGTMSVASDRNGNVAAAGYTTGTAVAGSLTQFNASGSPYSGGPVATGSVTPGGSAADGTSFFVANNVAGGGLAKVTVGSTTGATLLGSLNAPMGVAVDAAGSVWTANSGANTVSKFIGLAAPVTVPMASNVGP